MPNRLQFETSPYLLQHAHNPVDWFPWGQEALEKARSENKPILISIGYSACHWCHVMERESFENPDTAAMMNNWFVNIKVDREERPDLDQVYMDAVQAISGSGGWPLNVFLTPDARPFYGGTYFPPVQAYNRSSWREVMSAIHQAWTNKPEEILSQAENLTDHVANASAFGTAPAGKPLPGPQELQQAATQLMRQADTRWGGFGGAPKFPQTGSILFLLRQVHYHRQQAPAQLAELPYEPADLLKQAATSLSRMAGGGLYDHLGGGFARYSTDVQWLAPHFEKMLYDNALLLMAFAEGWQVSGNSAYLRVITETVDFVLRDMLSPEGLFYAAYDADSEGVEGKFYTWSLEELQSVLGDHTSFADHFCSYYNLSAEGNWEHTNILWTPVDLAEYCQANQLDELVFATELADARQKLWAHREGRIKPQLDDKILLGWNALMVEALVRVSHVANRPDWLEAAQRAAIALERHLAVGDGRFFHNYKAGRAANPAFLDDLAAWISALQHLSAATGHQHWLELAGSLCQQVINEFSDEADTFFYYTPNWQTDILIRKKDTYDGAIPSGNSMMALNLLQLGLLLNRPEWRERAAAMVSTVQQLVVRYPASYAHWGLAAQAMAYGIDELAIVGPHCQELSAQVLGQYRPWRVVQQALAADESYPLLAGRVPAHGQTLIYKCRDYACQRPVSRVEELE